MLKVDADRVRVAHLATLSDFQAVASDLEAFFELLSLPQGDAGFQAATEWAAQSGASVYLFYADDQPAMVIALERFRRSAEIHGAVLPAFRRSGVTDLASKAVIDIAAQSGTMKLIAKVPKGNKGAIGWCWRHGLRPTGRIEGDMIVYSRRLIREEHVA